MDATELGLALISVAVATTAGVLVARRRGSARIAMVGTIGTAFLLGYLVFLVVQSAANARVE